MELTIYQIDAFAEKVFEGNPAAVCPLDVWLSDEVLQSIALENNLSETAYFVKKNNKYHIRWFTPLLEVALCGHATLASAYVIFEILGTKESEIVFHSKSGDLKVSQKDDWFELDFPVSLIEPCKTPQQLIEAFGKEPLEVWKCDDYLVVFENEADVTSLCPDFRILRELDCRGVITTSRGENVDFISRFFAPRFGINEDPVTGSAHCALTPYWANKLGKAKLSAEQLSKRGGKLRCELAGNRVLIAGKAV